jgi:hypothetical protein
MKSYLKNPATLKMHKIGIDQTKGNRLNKFLKIFSL